MCIIQNPIEIFKFQFTCWITSKYDAELHSRIKFSRIQLSVLYLYGLKIQFNILWVSPIQITPHEPWQNCAHPHDHADILRWASEDEETTSQYRGLWTTKITKTPIQRGNTNSHACSYTGSNETYFKEHNSDLHTATTRSEETGGLHYNPVTATECDWNHTRAHTFYRHTCSTSWPHVSTDMLENIANT